MASEWPLQKNLLKRPPHQRPPPIYDHFFCNQMSIFLFIDLSRATTCNLRPLLMCNQGGRFKRFYCILDDKPWTEYVNMILSHTRWLVWKSRCKNRYEDPEDKHTNLLNYVKSGLKNHIRILLKVNKGKRIECSKSNLQCF